MSEIIIAIVLLVLSLSLFLMSIRSFMQKGFLFNNAYIYADQKERDNMDKKPYYRQSAIALFMVGVIFLLEGIDVIFKTRCIKYVVLAAAILTVIYAVASSIRISMKK